MASAQVRHVHVAGIVKIGKEDIKNWKERDGSTTVEFYLTIGMVMMQYA